MGKLDYQFPQPPHRHPWVVELEPGYLAGIFNFLGKPADCQAGFPIAMFLSRNVAKDAARTLRQAWPKLRVRAVKVRVTEAESEL